MCVGKYALELYRYPPLVFELNTSEGACYMYYTRKDPRADSIPRKQQITAEDAIKRFSKDRNWPLDCHSSTEIKMAMDSVEIPSKHRYKLSQFITDFQRTWLGTIIDRQSKREHVEPALSDDDLRFELNTPNNMNKKSPVSSGEDGTTNSGFKKVQKNKKSRKRGKKRRTPDVDPDTQDLLESLSQKPFKKGLKVCPICVALDLLKYYCLFVVLVYETIY